MNKRTIRILGIIFVLLLGIVVYPQVKNRFFPNTNKPTKPSYLLFNVDGINKISVKNSAEEVILEKKNGNWNVAELPVDEEKITSLLEALRNFEVKSIASKNKDNFSVFGVDDSQSLSLNISTDGNDYKFIIGKNGPTANTFYGKGENEEIVYLFEGVLKNQLETARNYWVDKTVVSLEKDEIVKIEVESADQLLLKKVNDKWTISFQNKSYDLTDEEAMQIFNHFSPLDAYDLASSEEKNIFDKEKNKTMINIFDSNNINLASLTLVMKDNNYLLSIKDKDYLYKVYKYKFDDLFNLKNKVQ